MGSRRAASLAGTCLAVLALVASTLLPGTGGAASAAPVGQGFSLNSADVAFLLQQVQIGERHAAQATRLDPCGGLVGTGPDQLRSSLLPLGLRTVDGSCNNLQPGSETWAAADRPFPRLTSVRLRDADQSPAAFGPPRATSYRQTSGSVFDADPRIISRLVSDQTAANPAAVAAAGHPVRSQEQDGIAPCTTDPDPVTGAPGVPAGCVPTGQTLPIPSVSTDVGLSPPFNMLFTLFGQFFDHGIDQTTKGGGTVFVPLAADDPLVLGPDGRSGTDDDLPVSERFMVLTRARNAPGPDGQLGTADDVKDAINTDTPWVDLSQAYASHASHQVFLREYALVDRVPVDTGRLLGGPSDGGEDGLPTWATLKRQAREVLGLDLRDADALAVPMIAADAYGNFVRGPHGLPQYVTPSGLVEGDLLHPVRPPADTIREDAPFLTDIAHRADPSPQDVDHDPATPRTAPAPDDDAVASRRPLLASPGTYDDELLDAHYVAGDGRVNENIGLTSIHQVFEREHNRVVGELTRLIDSDTSTRGLTARAAWHGPGSAGWSYGQRLFQAARLVTETQYQHIVFEEFVRTVEPDVGLFGSYQPEVDAAIPAEFAHAVYRFGHSMLGDVVARRSATGASYDTPLLDAFLDPLSFREGPDGTRLTPAAAAGGIILGTSDQVGQEIDEFVTRTLQDNLLGLPLDLAAINIARGRSEGVPRLNEFRRERHEADGAGELAPYTSWNDLAQNLRHPETLVNLVAAYGTHPEVRPTGVDGVPGTADDLTTVVARRAAAQQLIDPNDGSSPSADALEFLDATGAWALRPTGLDDVDLWIGGLAEVTSTNGGLLGTTFARVFTDALENLQNADRLYYIPRLTGTNLLTQVEGTSFAELVTRNTTGTRALKVNPFAVADCHFVLEHLGGTPEGYAAAGASVADDPATGCDESALLLRKPDGTLAYRLSNSVDLPGRNAQSVYDGTSLADRIVAGNDNDTIWGDEGADRLDAGTGDDVVLGGEGDDTITDAGGVDQLRGGPGDDVIDGGPGLDALLGGDGTDVVAGGSQDDEVLSGIGDDLVTLGSGNDAALGGDGSDWIEGGDGADTLTGDEGGLLLARRSSDPAGHDVLIGGAGDSGYDGEDGDDVLSLGPSLEDANGGGGWDWATHQYDTGKADDDLLVNQAALAPGQVVVELRDRWQEVEALSGTNGDDVLRGDNEVPRLVGGNGAAGCNVLDAAGIARVSGLAALLPEPTGDLEPVRAASALGDCPLEGPVWGEGNIVLGGGGADVLEGRGGDDVIDGDHVLRVRLSVRTDPSDPTSEIGSATSLDGPWRSGSTQTLVAALRAGGVSPAQVVPVRSIVDAGDGAMDRAVFFGDRSDYAISAAADGTLTVRQVSPVLKSEGQDVSDGTDTLRGIERLQFADRTIVPAVPHAPSIGSARATPGALSVSWSAARASDHLAANGFDLEVLADGVVATYVRGLASTVTSYVVSDLPAADAYTVRVRAANAFGPGDWSAPRVTKVGVHRPSAASLEVVVGGTSLTARWAAGDDGGAPVDIWNLEVWSAGVRVSSRMLPGTSTTAVVGGLVRGAGHTVRLRARNSTGWSTWATAAALLDPTSAPEAPGLLRPLPGAVGGPLTAVARWTPPASDGGRPITGYRVHVYRLTTPTTLTLSDVFTAAPGASSLDMRLPAGVYRVRVSAVNGVGEGARSVVSATVAPR